MPRVAEHALIWSPERDAYALSARGSVNHDPIHEEDALWFAWLAARSSFSFQGKHGHITLRKEARPRGESYWYAYRNQGHKTAKLYVGRNADLTIVRLETTVQALSAITAEKHAVPDTQVTTVEARQQPPLLTPKLHLPRLHSSHVVRERLLVRLDAGLERKLTLLSAPAGFGKTTLVSQWLTDGKTPSGASHYLLPIAWVSLDSGDDDPVRFWRYVITACQSFQADLGKSALALLLAESSAWHPTFGQPDLEAVLTTFLNEASQIPARGVLVLEDYHCITSPQIHETLAYLIEHLPAALHIVIITRGDPPFPLARLRAHDDLVELHAADLRFSLEETRAFFQQATQFSLSAEAIKRLEARTEGWVTGLRLLALALQGRVSELEIEDFLTTFAGSHRHLLEFFVTEVLGAQPETLQFFLLQTSILGRLTGSLCDAVTGRNDSDLLIEMLERANLFLQPLDGAGQWHRYHTLFAEAMQHEARRRLGEDALHSCYGKASGWYEEHRMLAEAVEAALSARDFARAAILIERLVEERQLMEGHELHTLRRWLEQVSEAEMERHPVLCFYHAIVQAFSSEQQNSTTFERVEALLQMAERAWRAEGKLASLGEALAFRSLMSIWQGEIVRAATFARQALAWLPEEEVLWRGTSLSIVAGGELAMGQFNAAREMMLHALELCVASGNRFAVRASIITLGQIYYGQGELRRAAELYRRILDEAEDDISDRQRALAGLSEITYEWNELENTQQQAQETLDLGKRLADETHQGRSSLVLARVLYARGETQRAWQMLLTMLAQTPAKLPALDREVLACQAQFSLAEGDISAAQRWSVARAPYDEALDRTLQEREELLVARLLIAQEKAEEALHALERCLTEAREAGRTRSALEIQLLIALAYRSRKQAQKARSLLREVLALAHSEGYQRLFIDEGEPMADLLRATLPEIREKPLITYIHTLLRAFSHPATPTSLIEPLSPQEERVLRLLAAGQSRQEIARELVVSINTVKTHLQRIYQKLNVSSRQEAREAARSLHLL